MRSFYKLEGYKQKPTSKSLTKAVINHNQNSRLSRSLLLPEKFQYYLDNVYFANFKPGTQPDLGRHSLAHGEARAEDFSLKSSTLGFLILYQLSVFF